MSYRADKQVIDTHTLTDTQTGAMTIPEGQNWPRVKIGVADLVNISYRTNFCPLNQEFDFLWGKYWNLWFL